MSKVAIIMGSKSDFSVVKPAADVLKSFGVETEVRVISAHRTPEEPRGGQSGSPRRGNRGEHNASRNRTSRKNGYDGRA